MPGRFQEEARSDSGPTSIHAGSAANGIGSGFEERNNTLLDTPSLLLQAVIVPSDKTQKGN